MRVAQSPAPQPRWSIYAQVVPRRAQIPCQWNAVNISKSGIFVAGDPLLKAGSQIDVTLHLPGAYGPSLEVDGRVEVVWNRGPKDASHARPSGMGCRFISLNGSNRTSLDAYIDELSSHRPADSGGFKVPAGPAVDLSESSVEVEVEVEAFEEEPILLTAEETLGPYAIVRHLGTGGMGDVFLAEHRLIGRRVAIKRLHRRFAQDPTSVRRFFDEARLVNQISHPNIVEITDLVSEPGMMYYVMEYIEGTTLLDRLQEGAQLPMKRVLKIGLQLADALTAVHNAGIIHRDLKPDNVLLTKRHGRRDFVKLLDFGIAKLRSAHETSKRQTLNGFVIGTPGYMSPEQVTNRDLDQRTDIYALGILLHEMLTGKRAFVARTLGELMLKQASQLPEAPVSSTGEEIPPALERLIMTCLALSPDERPSSTREVQQVLAAVLESLPRREPTRIRN